MNLSMILHVYSPEQQQKSSQWVNVSLTLMAMNYRYNWETEKETRHFRKTQMNMWRYIDKMIDDESVVQEIIMYTCILINNCLVP